MLTVNTGSISLSEACTNKKNQKWNWDWTQSSLRFQINYPLIKRNIKLTQPPVTNMIKQLIWRKTKICDQTLYYTPYLLYRSLCRTEIRKKEKRSIYVNIHVKKIFINVTITSEKTYNVARLQMRTLKTSKGRGLRQTAVWFIKFYWDLSFTTSLTAFRTRITSLMKRTPQRCCSTVNRFYLLTLNSRIYRSLALQNHKRGCLIRNNLPAQWTGTPSGSEVIALPLSFSSCSSSSSSCWGSCVVPLPLAPKAALRRSPPGPSSPCSASPACRCADWASGNSPSDEKGKRTESFNKSRLIYIALLYCNSRGLLGCNIWMAIMFQAPQTENLPVWPLWCTFPGRTW